MDYFLGDLVDSPDPHGHLKYFNNRQTTYCMAMETKLLLLPPLPF